MSRLGFLLAIFVLVFLAVTFGLSALAALFGGIPGG